ncbi:phage tail protein [Streptomyces shenzhenensis]|uniref:phage tail protein n=1 Tax=Streptomyces shenzhenensis TaxID=943815 RepID=UPI001F2F5F20|nr:phage tail protein [Streptomyces shenzhenensis]
MAGDEVEIRVRVTADQAHRAFRDLKTEASNLRGSLIPLATAAAPLAAAMAPVAAKAAGAGVAVAAFGAALKPQITNMAAAAKAQDAYTTAVTKYGAGSKQALQAQQFIADTLKGMPAATQRAAAAYSSLRDEFKAFSDSTAKFTMVPVEHSFAVLGQLIPKLTPMAESAAGQLDRLVKVAGGAVASPGLDALAGRLDTFANQSLKEATDEAIHFMRVLSEGGTSGPLKTFMEYAAKEGPAVRETLRNVGEAVKTLVEASSEAGPGMLSLVNAAAKLVAALPPSLVATMMQAAVALKAMRLAGAGFDVAAAGVAVFSARLAALRAVSTAAGGGVTGLNAALASMSTKAKIGLAAGAVGALVLALHELSDNKPAVAVDALSTSLNTLVTTGKVTGALKTNFTEMSESIAMVSKGASDNKFTQLISDFGTFVGISTGPGISDARKNVDAWDKSMANLVKSGNSKEAAAQYDLLKKAWVAGGGDLKRLGKFTDDYHNALADQKFESKLAAEGMGLFGEQAQKTAATLDQQKASADGLRQSIEALNDANRASLGGMIGFEQAIDDTAKAAKANHGALSMTNGVLNLSSQKSRDAASALQDLADKTSAAGTAQREAGASWETVNGVYARGRANLIKNAEAMGLSKDQAKALSSQLLQIPADVVSKVRMNTEDAKAGLESFNAALKRTPGAKSVTLKALSASGEQVLEAFGLKVKRLPNGKVKVTAAAGGALAAISNVAGALNSLDGKTAHTYVIQATKTSNAGTVYHEGGKYARGGLVRRMADGGAIEGGSGTQDDVPLLAMGGEFIVSKKQTQKYRAMLEAINEDRVPHFAKGGLTQAQKDARGQLRGQFGISSFGRLAGYERTPFERSLGAPSDMSSLVSALNSVAGQIRAAFSGHTESSLLHRLSSVGKSLIGYEKQLNSVTKSLASAKDKLNSLKDASSQLASSVKSGILSSANITAGAAGTTQTVASIMGGLTQSRDQATAFASALKQLKAKGLSASLIQQIGEAGISGGGLETAGALLGASSSEISSLNSLQGQINSAAGSAGKTTADSVYAKAIKDQTGVVTKLTHQQEKLEGAMASLAKTMEKLIKQALKGKASGGIVGAAASGGLRSDLTWVGEHGPELLDLPAGARVWSNPDSRRLAAGQAPWASMLNSPRRAGGSAASGGREQVVRVEVEIVPPRGGEHGIQDAFLKIIRQSIRLRGGNVQRVLSGGYR